VNIEDSEAEPVVEDRTDGGMHVLHDGLAKRSDNPAPVYVGVNNRKSAGHKDSLSA